MGADRYGGPGVEFIPDPHDRATHDRATHDRATLDASARPRRHAAAWIAAALLAALVTGTAVHHATAPDAHRAIPAPAPTRATSSTPAPPPAVHVVTADLPSPALAQAIATDIPGAIATSERTVLGRDARGRAVVTSRQVDAVSGNVVIAVGVTTVASAVPQPRRTGFVHAGYRITFAFTGYYPPPTAQLRALADDPVLTAA